MQYHNFEREARSTTHTQKLKHSKLIQIKLIKNMRLIHKDDT